MKKLLVFGLVLGFAVAGTAQASTLHVDPSGIWTEGEATSTAYTTIQAAVDAAAPGDMINVAVGTYAESVLVNKALILSGGNGTKPVISGLAPDNYIVKVTGASDVTLDNLEINGGGIAAGDNTFSYGVWVSGSGAEGSPVEIKNSIVKNVWNASPTAAIDVDSTSYALINNVDVSGFQKRGIRFTNSSGKVFDGDVMGESVDGTTRVQNLINLWGGSSVEIYNNTLHDAKSSGGTPTWDSPAIFISSYGGSGNSQANVHDNEIYNGDTGIVVTSVYATVDGSSATVTNNNFHDLNWGINFETETGSAVVHENSFTTVNKAVNAEGDGSPLATPPATNAENNWWGTHASSTFASQISGLVDFDPWYVDAAKTSLSDIPLTITLNGDATTMVWTANGFTDLGVTATGPLVQVSTSGSVNDDVAGTYVLTYTATDVFENTVSTTRTVVVQASSNGGGGRSSGAASSQALQAVNNAGVTLPPPAAGVIGQVLGETTMNVANMTVAERQAAIVSVRSQIAGLIQQLLGLLQAQLAAAIAAGN
ncbi:MAG: hypothetical protein A3J09_00905 [Candidatus Zambryskibacteria bacterium RIFCSPLOWO2_02_FULL_51_21]|uniref:Pesticidal crystal protein Cry22Aa Ig-like domain-containing protein n=1 Tax=Candidatus Zambryskibacteria bacterium RIFCSPHIGHO2_02_FULL_43_37 TaxID=1802749 RepID=A0A1G2THJ8_9BACT|nr:MAG: hypothetical protein A2723_00905 [Candidatus Zambryskibacteria bacterium RIFCSPHIGHO2_01_FULL_52_18]OHA96757.1 MAG: hypothetical protein A3D49_02865 [Candidatus Zambryskibacteria bacterium RIFCSPHIGHO2_02_FULL_43_37]OHB07450.1 MAG: hypothetical protein A2944_01935 [Candidatus Zambryskibacteria bacterium RIFCSPLOWO2_01_FULL_52_12]OHB11113.1 MAG: hypothetical protein A3J09_00905 [Candidatus Zambryskibacteria bacterium RIFCSPLOWO2_02_FULL_51_21]